MIQGMMINTIIMMAGVEAKIFYISISSRLK